MDTIATKDAYLDHRLLTPDCIFSSFVPRSGRGLAKRFTFTKLVSPPQNQQDDAQGTARPTLKALRVTGEADSRQNSQDFRAVRSVLRGGSTRPAMSLCESSRMGYLPCATRSRGKKEETSRTTPQAICSLVNVEGERA